jgi:hypothetical protein
MDRRQIAGLFALQQTQEFPRAEKGWDRQLFPTFVVCRN